MSDMTKPDTMILEPALTGGAGSADLLEDSLLDDMGAGATRTRDLSRPRRSVRRGESNSGGFLANLRIRRKLALIVLAFLIPLAAVSALFFFSQRAVLLRAESELNGLEYLTPLESALESIALHRNLTMRYANAGVAGRTALEPQITAAASGVDTALASLVMADQMTSRELQTDQAISELVATWESLQRRALTLSSSASFAEHSLLTSSGIVPLLESVGDRSGLGRSAGLSDYILAKLTVEALPTMSENLSQLRDLGSGVVTRRIITSEERQQINALVTRIEADFGEIKRDINSVAEGKPEQAQELRANLAEFESLANYTVSLTRWNVVERFNTDLLPATFFREATRSVDTGFNFLNTNVSLLKEDLEAQVATLRFRRLLNLGLLLLGLAVSIWLVLRIGRQITRPVDELAEVAGLVSQGDLSQFAQVGARDELGTLAASFNQAIVGLRQATERNEVDRQQSDELQRNVGQFLDVAMDIADGDFTKRGTVTEDVLGNVVDAINLMVDEVSGLLLEVRNASESVAQGSGGMLNTTQAISDTTTQQSQEAQKARQVTSSVTESMREMSQNAQASAVAAGQALTASAQSQEAVDGTLQGMQNIRREVQAISKRIKSLGDRSLEISEIVDTISSISSQTHLLALNAAIEAAGAGAAGERFAVVAGEVRKLSEDSARATQRVATLIQDIQSEVQEVVGSVEDGTQEVEAGYRVATEAGARLKEVAAIVQESAQFAKSISDITQAQVSQVENVDSSVRSIADLSEASQVQVRQGRESAEQLKALAEQLRESLSRFRLA